MDEEENGSYPLTFIEWQDARGVDGDWEYLDDFEHVGTCNIHTLGFLIPNPGNQYLTIVQSISSDTTKNAQISGVTYIPLVSIVRKITIPDMFLGTENPIGDHK